MRVSYIMHKLKLLLIIILFLTNYNCKSYILMEENKIDPEIHKMAKTRKDLKIALIGFYTFNSKLIQSTGRTRTYQATLDYNSSTKEYFIYGKPIESFASNGRNEAISPELVNQLIKDYYYSVSDSGLVEMIKLFEFNKIDSKLNISLRKRDVDYYIVGVHGPPFQDHFSKQLKFMISFPLYILTLGCSPVWEEVVTESKFNIYDSKLNLIKSLNYNNKYNILISWFGTENNIEIKSLYKPDINNLTNALFETISYLEKNEKYLPSE